jgi:hypothetical protein
MAATPLTGRLPILLALDVSILVPGLYLAGALLAGAVVLALIRRWRQNEETVSADPSDQLARFRTLYEQGAISEEEFKRLRAVLGAELRRSIDLPPPPAPPGPAASDAGKPGPGSEKNGEVAPPPADGIRQA